MSACPVAHDYDPLAPSTLRDPYPVLTEMREAGPVFYLPELDHYIVTRYDDIERVLLDRDTWSASNASSPLNPVCPAAQEVLAAGFKRVPTLNNADPPRHGPMRKAVLACMTPRRLNALEPTLRAYAEDLVESFRNEPVVDFVAEFAFPFPGFAAFSLLGFPETGHRPAEGVEPHPRAAHLRAPVGGRAGAGGRRRRRHVAVRRSPRGRTRRRRPPTTSRATCCATQPRSPTW